MLHSEGRAVVQPSFAVLQILQIAVIVGGKVARFRRRQPGIEQAVDIINLRLGWIENGHRMFDSVTSEGLALVKAPQVVGHVLVGAKSDRLLFVRKCHVADCTCKASIVSSCCWLMNEKW